MTKSRVESEKINLKELLRIDDRATVLRQQREEAERQIDIDELKAHYKKILIEKTKITRGELREEEINAAINSYLSELYSFKEPSKGFALALAKMYIDRKRIGKQYGVPALIIAAISSLTWLGVKGYTAAYRHSLEKRVETAIEEKYQEKEKIRNDIRTLSSSLSKLQEPEAAELRNIISSSEERVRTSDSFFNEFCSRGTASDDVNQKNYEIAKQQLASVTPILNTARTNVDKGKGILQDREQIVSTKQSLESLIQEIRNDNPPTILVSKAEAAYQSGLVSLEKKQVSQAQNYRQELIQIKTDTKDFAVLPQAAERLYNSIKATAKEKKALDLCETIYSEGQLDTRNVDVRGLKKNVQALKDIDDTLREEYTSRIVSKPGVKSGIDRYYEGRLSGYYLILEAVDSRGNILQRRIKNEEDGKTDTVNMWGERVPEEIYERVKSDKLDNGIIENNIFGRKQKGYLTEEVTMLGSDKKPLEKKGQITEW